MLGSKMDPESTVWAEWRWFDAVERLLSNAVELADSCGSREVSAVFPYLDAALESDGSLRVLASQNRLRDSYVVARAIYETLLNACFILTDVEVLGSRANTHAKQKALRSLVRSIEVAGETVFKFEMKGAHDLLSHPEHQRWLDEFTTRSGREVSAWTPENVPQRLDAVHRHFGSSESRGLAFGLLLYRHASEIAHGTLFGTLFSWGAMEVGRPLSCPADIAKFRQKELKHLIKLVAYSHESMLRILAPKVSAAHLSVEAMEARVAYYRDREAHA